MEENQLKFKKILICLYIIIGLLAIDTIILFTNNVKITTSSEQAGLSENVDYDVSMFTSVNAKEAVKAFDSNDMQVIYIGRSTCGFCVKFLPVLQQAQKDFGYKTKYLDITTITNEEDQELLLSKDNDENFLTKNYGSTPLVLLVKDGKLIKGWVGYSEYSQFAQFLTENGMKKD